MANLPPKEKHDHTTLKFPDGFLWGAATSAYQIEGNNINTDWWEWEKKHQPEDKHSGEAADHYNRFKDDFKMARELGHNSHRLSIEWSRIEPEPGKFNQTEIDHYKEVLKSLKDQGLTVMLTLHHFTNPLWFAKKGGWTNLWAPFYFNRFVKKIAPELKEYVDMWITINEPGLYAWAAYLDGRFPPQKKSFFQTFICLWNMSRAHNKAYKSLHQLMPKTQVGIAHNAMSLQIFHRHSFLEAIVAWGYDLLINHLFFKLSGLKTHDFLGINYYFNQYISFNGNKRLPTMTDIYQVKQDVSDLGWEIHPEGMFSVLTDFSDYHKPIYITENGIASTNDDRRVRFLLAYLKEIYHAIAVGCDVRGYFHWSLLDNFEWENGYNPRFGLVEVDYSTQKRIPRPSSQVYKEIIKYNGIPHYLLKLLGHTVKAEEVLNHPHDV